MDERAAALERAWARALKNAYSGVAGESLLVLTRDMAPNAAAGGVLARAALISGESEAAMRWFLALRSQPAASVRKCRYWLRKPHLEKNMPGLAQ